MAIVKPSTILEPFAINGDLVVPPSAPSPIVANQDTGFPLLQSTPIGAGGLPVNREQMNGVINLYSQFCFWQQCGGVYTFDAAISAQYGGYPAGIVLYCASNNSFQASLINNNTANFVTTPSYINDGIHWHQIGGSTLSQSTTSGFTTTTLTDSTGYIIKTISGNMSSLSGNNIIFNYDSPFPNICFYANANITNYNINASPVQVDFYSSLSSVTIEFSTAISSINAGKICIVAHGK